MTISNQEIEDRLTFLEVHSLYHSQLLDILREAISMKSKKMRRYLDNAESALSEAEQGVDTLH